MNENSILSALCDTESVTDYKTAVFIGGLVFFLLWESIFPFMDLFRRNFKERGWHGIKNLALGAINAFTIALCFVLIWLWVAEWSNRRGFGLLNWLSLSSWWHAVQNSAFYAQGYDKLNAMANGCHLYLNSLPEAVVQ
jgi:hypothetical protein